MIRLFLPPEQLTSDHIIITGEQARYLSSVLRVRPGEAVTIFDGLGFRYSCRIIRCHKKEVLAERMKKESCPAESPVAVTLAQGIAKGDKMDLIIQKSTELGVAKTIPLITDRSQVRRTKKTERWKKIALSASQQSGRSVVPDIEEPALLSDFLERHIPRHARGYVEDIKGVSIDDGSGIIFSEGHETWNLRKILSGMKGVRKLTLLIGPEGGFSEDEVSSAKERGFIEASLGPRILRTETAPIAALSIIQYELGDLTE